MHDDLELIRDLEERCFRAWPAAEAVDCDGWVLRATSNCTRRANSVWPREHGTGLAEKLLAVRRFYAERGLPARFQLCPAARPAHLDDILDAEGYVSASGITAVEVAETDMVLEATKPRAGHALEQCPHLTDEWLKAYLKGDPIPDVLVPHKRGILARISQPAIFVLLRMDGLPAAVALGIADGGWAGVFCVATVPEFRRRGAADTLLHSLALWAKAAGCGRMRLQVLADNHSARSLYGRAGFRTVYHYHYRELSGPSVPEPAAVGCSTSSIAHGGTRELPETR